jgi:hypothetical protein
MTEPVPPHEDVEQLIAAQALDGLDPSEVTELRRRMAEHGPDCAECERLTTAYSEVAARLAMVLDPVPLTEGAEDLLIQAARAPGTGDAPSAVEVADLETARRERLVRGGGAGRWTAIAAVAAAVAIVAGAIGYLVAPRTAGLEVVAFPPRAGQQLAVAIQEGADRGWVIGSGLEEPPDGMVYELWYRRTGSERMEAAGTFVPEQGAVFEEVGLAESIDLLAVTLERGFQRQPTSEPVFSTPL